jgi:hypothetical protein
MLVAGAKAEARSRVRPRILARHDERNLVCVDLAWCLRALHDRDEMAGRHINIASVGAFRSPRLVLYGARRPIQATGTPRASWRCTGFASAAWRRAWSTRIAVEWFDEKKMAERGRKLLAGRIGVPDDTGRAGPDAGVGSRVGSTGRR